MPTKSMSNSRENLKAFFEANAGNVNLSQKIDPNTGI